MDKIKTILLCNSRIAIPAVQELFFYGNLAAVIVPATNKDVTGDLQAVLPNNPVPIILATRKTLDAQVLEVLNETSADTGMVMTFPYKLTKAVYKAPARGFFNFHYGVLPQYRGPEPIFAQIRNRENTAGITVHLVNEEIDAGPVCMLEKTRIEPEDTYGTVQSKLAYLGAKLAGNLIKALSFSNTIPSKAQDESAAVYHQKPGLKDVLINWNEMDSAEIRALVNACNPWNKGAGARIRNWVVGLLEVEITSEETAKNIAPGTIVSLNSGSLLIATSDQKILNVKVIYCPEGFMSGQRLKKFGIKEGDRFE